MLKKDESKTAPPHEGGLVGGFMQKVFGRNWRTSVSGIGIVIGTVAVQLEEGIPTTTFGWVKFGLGIASGAGLMVAKDGVVSGTKANPRN